MGARVFISYSHRDEDLRDQLEVQLAMLKHQGLVETWHDRRLLAGDRLDWSISKELDEADVILLLLSPDFLASDYCYKIEKARALERHVEGSARLVSVILRPCDWQHTDLSQFLVTPRDGLPITKWPDRDEAFLDVVSAIRRVIEELGLTQEPKQTHELVEAVRAPEPEASLPRSSNLRLRKKFTQADRDRFLFDAFEFMDKFFQGSLRELQARNPGIETRHRRVDGNGFTGTIYRDGQKVAGCTVRVGGMIGPAITYFGDDSGLANTHNESMSIDNDDQKLFLRPMGMPGLGTGERHLSEEGAAEYYWSMLIERLQG